MNTSLKSRYFLVKLCLGVFICWSSGLLSETEDEIEQVKPEKSIEERDEKQAVHKRRVNMFELKPEEEEDKPKIDTEATSHVGVLDKNPVNLSGTDQSRSRVYTEDERPDCLLIANTDHLEFGKVLVGYTSDKSLTLKNQGKGLCSLRYVGKDLSGRFIIQDQYSGGEILLGESQLVTINIQFLSVEAGDYNEELSFIIEELNKKVIIPLKGTAN